MNGLNASSLDGQFKMEMTTISSSESGPSVILDGATLIHRPRPKPTMQLPTVCVSSLTDPLQQTFNLLTESSATNSESPIVSPVFVDTSNTATENPHGFRLSSGGATSAMLHTDRWFGYRHERNSSSSSDSGLAFPFSPPANTLGLSSPSLSLSISPISPPGLSPLQISTDSAFSTPTPSSNNRLRTHFTFDHLPSSNLPKKEEIPQANSLNYTTPTNALTELLLRRVSEQQRLQEQLVSAIVGSTPTDTLQSNKASVFRCESLPMVQNVQQQSEIEKLLHNFNIIQQAQNLGVFNQNQQHSPIGRTASLNTSINANSTGTKNTAIFVTPQIPVQKQPLLLQRPPLKATLSSPLNSTTSLPQNNNESVLRRTESTKRKLLKSNNSKDAEEPKIKNVATNSLAATEGNDEDRQQFICRFCNKDFRRPDILSRHLRRHTGEKPFCCDCCGRNFSRSDHLRTHRRTHTNEKPYACSACNYAARRRDVLTRHMATRHQQKAGPSFPQRRGKRSATLQPLPRSPLADAENCVDAKAKELLINSTTDDEESNIYIDVTCVDSDEDDLSIKKSPENKEREKETNESNPVE